ncbi:hypothetical protein [Nonomuraea sp. NPDC003804]|uniref:hypothetical protein n=1 Tax=Nonomuraea sp. NPDC003804 TaxID=3154547 RepID=UPI0033AEE522
MISDAWAQAKGRIAHILGREADEQDDFLQEWEVSRITLLHALESGDSARVATIEAEWRSRLLRLLQSEPSLIEKLQSLPAVPVASMEVVYEFDLVTSVAAVK